MSRDWSRRPSERDRDRDRDRDRERERERERERYWEERERERQWAEYYERRGRSASGWGWERERERDHHWDERRAYRSPPRRERDRDRERSPPPPPAPAPAPAPAPRKTQSPPPALALAPAPAAVAAAAPAVRHFSAAHTLTPDLDSELLALDATRRAGVLAFYTRDTTRARDQLTDATLDLINHQTRSASTEDALRVAIDSAEAYSLAENQKELLAHRAAV